MRACDAEGGLIILMLLVFGCALLGAAVDLIKWWLIPLIPDPVLHLMAMVAVVSVVVVAVCFMVSMWSERDDGDQSGF